MQQIIAASADCSSFRLGAMKLYAPNAALYVIAACLALLGVLAALPISLPIPALTGNPSWYIFLAWFLLAAGTALPHDDERSRSE
jgi:hypothetical protein